MNCQEGTDLTLTHTSPVISIAAPGVKLRKVVSSPKDFSRFVCVASICLAFYLKGLLWPNLIPIPLRIPLGLSLVSTPFFGIPFRVESEMLRQDPSVEEADAHVRECAVQFQEVEKLA